jgi:hypothetical protein
MVLSVTWLYSIEWKDDRKLVMKLQNKIVYSKKLFSVDTKYFGPGSKGRVHCYTAEMGFPC